MADWNSPEGNIVELNAARIMQGRQMMIQIPGGVNHNNSGTHICCLYFSFKRQQVKQKQIVFSCLSTVLVKSPGGVNIFPPK